MNRYFAYIRVSTQKQGVHGVSLQEQRAAIERYAERDGLSIVQWFEERETAAKRGRPVFAGMLKLLRQRRAAGVVIHKIDRSARNLKDWADLGELIDAGVEVRFATESLDLSMRSGRLSADIQAVVAADYVRNLREETRKGFYGRLKQGLYPIRAPIGYLDQGGGKPKVPDPERAALVRYAFERYATGEVTIEQLSHELDRAGLRNRQGGPISLNALNEILKNPFYAGVIRLRSTGETFPGVHEPIVSATVFDEVQAVLAGKTSRRTRREFLFPRLLSCRLCGYSLIGELQKSRVYYRCHTQGCPVTGLREDSAEGVVRSVLGEITLNSEQAAEILADCEAALRGEGGRQELEKTLVLQIKNVEVRLGRLTDALVDGVIDKTSHDERRERLLLELARLREQSKVWAEGDAQLDKLRRHLELAKTLAQSYDSATPGEKRAIVGNATSNRSFDGKNLSVELREPFRSIAEWRKMVDCDPSRDRPRTFWAKVVRGLRSWGENTPPRGTAKGWKHARETEGLDD